MTDQQSLLDQIAAARRSRDRVAVKLADAVIDEDSPTPWDIVYKEVRAVLADLKAQLKQEAAK